VTIASLIPDSLKTLNYSGIIFKRLFLFALLVSGVLSIFLFTVHPLRDETLKERGQDQQNEFSVIGTLWRIKIISPFVIALLVINIWFYSNFVFPLLPVEMGDRKSILN